MQEIWKDIDGTSGRYQISNLGNVRAFTRFRNGELLKPARYSNGYLFVHFAKDTDKKGERHSYLIHRLVAQAFLPNPDGLPQVNHKDEDKTNNIVDNLEWCTALYNNNYGTRNERISKNQNNDRKNKPILQFTSDGKFVKEWVSITEASKYGFQRRSIQRCLKGEYKRHYNFIWKYKN